MSNKNKPMNLERFTAIVDAYGGLPAGALDSLLDMPETAPVTRDLQDRILASRPVGMSRGRPAAVARSFSWSRWIPTAAVTCSLALGAAVGTQLPRIMGLDDDALALQAVASALTASSSDAEMFGGSE
jgi:hypothetical protein